MNMTHLTSKGNWGLVKALLLGVSDVRVNNAIKWQVMLSRLESNSMLLCLDGQLAANGVLDVEHGGVQVCWRELAHGVGKSSGGSGDLMGGRGSKERGQPL